MCCVGGVVSYARGNAWGLVFESHGTQRWEALFFLKLVEHLVLVGVLVPVLDPGLKGRMLTPGWRTGTRGGSSPGVKLCSLPV